jgi:hypothetical protein
MQVSGFSADSLPDRRRWHGFPPRPDCSQWLAINLRSGGAAMLADIRKLLPLEKEGVEGVVVGKAL